MDFHGLRSMPEYFVLYDVRIPMRDNIKLAANIYLPHRDGKFPVLLNVTPYGKDSAFRAPVRTQIWAFVRSGYAVVHVDVRGRGNSEGDFLPFFQEIVDGHDTLEWCGTQPWSSGNVGTFGKSYGGISQLYPMRLGSKYHKAAFVECSPTMHPFHDCTGYAYGAFMPIMRVWQTLLTERTNKEQIYDEGFDWEAWAGGRPMKEWASKVGLSEDIYSHLYEHETYDEYLKNVWEDSMVERMSVPCYFVTGWFDDSISGALEHFPALARRNSNPKTIQKLIIGPWAHTLSAPFHNDSKIGDFDYGSQSIVPLDKEAIRWFDYWLKGINNGIADEPPVRIYLMGPNRWMEYSSFPPSGTIAKSFYLSADGPSNTLDGKGRLGDDPNGESESSSFTYDPSHPAPSPFWKEAFQNGTNEDLRYIQKRDDVLVFTSEPLADPINVVGWVSAELFVSTSALDTDFVARLSDVRPDGYAQRLQHGLCRLRYREGFEKVKLVKPGEIIKIRIEMSATGHQFMEGHRVRLDVTSSAFPSYAPNFNTGESTWEEKNSIIARQRVYHSKDFPSRLILTVLPEPSFVATWTPTRWQGQHSGADKPQSSKAPSAETPSP
jgi:putative CocE/NonD family hydrolase